MVGWGAGLGILFDGQAGKRQTDAGPLSVGGIQLCTISSIQSLSCVRLFAIPWTVARQASLSITNSCSLLKLMSIWSVMPSNHLVLCCPLLLPSIFPSIRVFSNEFFAADSQSIRVSTSASVLPVNIQE